MVTYLLFSKIDSFQLKMAQNAYWLLHFIIINVQSENSVKCSLNIALKERRTHDTEVAQVK